LALLAMIKQRIIESLNLSLRLFVDKKVGDKLS